MKCHFTSLPSLSFLEGDEGEDTCLVSQEDIANAVDITSGAKVQRIFFFISNLAMLSEVIIFTKS